MDFVALIRRLLVVALALGFGAAYAVGPYQNLGEQYYGDSGGTIVGTAPGLQSYCNAFALYYGNASATAVIKTAATVNSSGIGSGGQCDATGGDFGTGHSYSNAIGGRCSGYAGSPAAQTLAGSSNPPSCFRSVSSCPSGQVANATTGICETPACPSSGSTTGSSSTVYQVVNGAPTVAVCVNSCSYTGTIGGSDANGSYVWGPLTSGGTACTGTATVPASPPPAGMCPGTVNGVSVLVPCSNFQSTATTAASSTSTTASGVTSGATATSTSTTTTCNGGLCSSTSTTRVTNPDGSHTDTTGTGTDPTEQDSFCRQNPHLSICKLSSIGGSCATVSCDGDAVQCAIAKEQQKRNCEFFGDAPSTAPAVLAANGQAIPADHPGAAGQMTTTPIGTFDQTDIVGGSCPADATFQVASGYPAVTIAFSRLCTPAQWLGNLLVGLTALACLGIVFSVKGG